MKNIFLLLLLCVTSVGYGQTQPYFEGSYQDLLTKSKSEKKAILLDFYTTWCEPCKKMDAETFTDSTLNTYLDKNYLVYKMDAENFDNMDVANKYKVKVYPTLIYLNSMGKQKGSSYGFLYPEELLANLKKAKKKK